MNDSVAMGEIVEFGYGEDSEGEKLGDDPPAEMATSDGESIDSVGIVREIRERR